MPRLGMGFLDPGMGTVFLVAIVHGPAFITDFIGWLHCERIMVRRHSWGTAAHSQKLWYRAAAWGRNDQTGIKRAERVSSCGFQVTDIRQKFVVGLFFLVYLVHLCEERDESIVGQNGNAFVFRNDDIVDEEVLVKSSGI